MKIYKGPQRHRRPSQATHRCIVCGRPGRVDSCICARQAGAVSKYQVRDTEDPAWVLVREPASREERMRRVDVEPCAACGLRGHVAGDPDRCLHGDATAGMGGMQIEQPMRRRTA